MGVLLGLGMVHSGSSSSFRQSGDVYRRLLSFGGEKYPRELIQLTAGEVPSVQALAKSLAEDVAGNLEQQRAARHKRLLE